MVGRDVQKKVRRCPICGQSFKSMTDRRWSYVLHEHLTQSKKHQLVPSISRIVVERFRSM